MNESIEKLRAADLVKYRRRAMLEGLRAIAVLRLHLAGLEQTYIAELRHDDEDTEYMRASWAEIGDALGLPRQAVHRKFSFLDGPGESSS